MTIVKPDLLFKLDGRASTGEAAMGRAVLECCDNIDFLMTLPREKFRLIVTSPPYNVGKEYEKR